MPLNIAHRGYSGRFPENTMRAFQEALLVGAQGLEFDVQLTRDNEPVVIHDEKLGRTADGTGYVSDYTWKELRSLDAGKWMDSSFRGERIPHLDEVLDFGAQEGLLMNIELKTGTLPYPGLVETVTNAISNKGIEEHVIISSFNHRTLMEVASFLPKVRTAIIYAAGMYKPWDYASQVHANALHPSWSFVDEYAVKGAHSAGMIVNTWTVNDVEDMDAAIALNVDGVITNFPDILSERLETSTQDAESDLP